MVTTWTIATAQLAGPDVGADRALTTDRVVIVVDGASAFRPVPITPNRYVDTLGPALLDHPLR